MNKKAPQRIQRGSHPVTAKHALHRPPHPMGQPLPRQETVNRFDSRATIFAALSDVQQPSRGNGEIQVLVWGKVEKRPDVFGTIASV